MRLSLLVSVAIALSCLGAAIGGFSTGRAGGPSLVLAVRAGSHAGTRSGIRVGVSAGLRAGYRAGYHAGFNHAYASAYRLAYRRTVGR